MLTAEAIERWEDNISYDQPGLAKDALTLSWIHWDEISKMSLAQMATLDSWRADVTYAGRTCACCRAFDCVSRFSAKSPCVLDLTGPYTAEQSQCCGGTWKMYHRAWRQWQEVGKTVNGQWLVILQTAAHDVREFIGLVLKGEA